MPESRKGRSLQAAFAVAGAIGAVVVLGYLRHLQSVSTSQPPPLPVAMAGQSVDQADGNEPLLEGPLPLGSVLGINRPAPPPVSISVGRSPGELDTPDLSTPAVAVYTVLPLLDRGATDKVAPCLLEETGDPASSLYPRYLGHPVSLVEVTEEEESAEVVWQATVHTAFSRDGKQHSPGETITLTTRLVQIDGLWKILQLHEGEENGDQQRDATAN